MRTTLRDTLLRALRRLRLLGPTYRVYQRALARRTARRSHALEAPDGLPIPPHDLIVLVAGPTTVENFLTKGRMGAELLRTTTQEDGAPLDRLDDVLDWGVGCGRIIRYLANSGPRLNGCDLNPELVGWVNENLPSVDARVNGLRPPLPYPDASFDLVYAFSVMTHLPAELQLPWVAEIRRVLRPGGRFIFTTHGDRHRAMLPSSDRTAYDRGELVVRFEDVPGSNLCGAHHPEAYVRDHLAAGWEIRLFQPEGAIANGRQDLWMFRSV